MSTHPRTSHADHFRAISPFYKKTPMHTLAQTAGTNSYPFNN